MKRGNYFIAAIAFFVFVLSMVSCERESDQVTKSHDFELFSEQLINKVYNANYGLKSTDLCNERVYTLIAGQHYYAGDLVVSNDGENLYVTFLLDGDCQYSEFHLFVGDVEDIPVNKKGVPVPGHFPYSNNSGSFVIPLAGLNDCFTILAHATCGEETIWARSATDFENNSFENVFDITRWGWIIEDCLNDCEEEMIITFKAFIKNTKTGATHIIAVPQGEIFDGDWCTKMGVLSDEEGIYDLIMPFVSPFPLIGGTIMVGISGNSPTITIEISDSQPDLMFWKVHIFYGTVEEFEALVNTCPNFNAFPVLVEEETRVISYTF